jgi:hypothetical protein
MANNKALSRLRHNGIQSPHLWRGLAWRRFSRNIAARLADDAQSDNDSRRVRKNRPGSPGAAQMLNELDHIQQYLIRVGQSDLEAALGAVLSSLAFAGMYHAFTVANEAPSIVAGLGPRNDVSKSAQARTDKHPSRDRQMAEEFQRRHQARDLAAGAIVGAPRPIDDELKRQIGAEHGLGKSAAMNAIDRGLAILNEMAAAINH